MKKIFFFIICIFYTNLTFAQSFDSRISYIDDGLNDISKYISENSSTDQKQQISNITNTTLFEIKEILNKSKEINPSKIKDLINKKIDKYQNDIKKYTTSKEADILITQFKKGFENAYRSNLPKQEINKHLNFQKQNKYYKQIYGKIENMLKKYPGEKYKTFLDKLSNKILEKKNRVQKSTLSNDKKAKYITMYETLELVISDFQNGK